MTPMMKILNELRMMKRNIALRKENDPAKVISVLEKIINESILIRGVDTESVIAKGVLEELGNIRNGLLTMRINAGPLQNNMIAKFSMILNELQNTQTRLQEEFGSGDGEEDQSLDKRIFRSAFDKITENIPSASAITSALIQANPLIGYSAKIILDFNQSRREYKQRTREEAQRRAEILNEQAEEIKRKLENLALEEEILNDQKNKSDEPTQEPDSPSDEISDVDDNTDPLDVAGIETIEAILEDIYEEMRQLNAVWQGDSNVDRDPLPITDKEEVFMQDVVKKLDDVDDGIKNESKLANLRKREEEIAARAQFIETRDMQSASPVTINDSKSASLGGVNILGGVNGIGKAGLMAGIGGVLGAMISAVVTPFVSLIKFLNPLSDIVSKTLKVGRVAGFIGTVYGIFEFIESFINAEDILGKDALDVSWWDRIMTGFAGFFVGFVEPFNMLSEWLFDYDFLGDKNERIKQLFNLYDAYWDWVFETSEYVWDALKTFVGNIPEYLNTLLGSVQTFFSDTLPAFGAYLKELPSTLWTSFDSFVSGFIEDLFDFIKEVAFGSIKALKDKAGEMKDDLFDFFNFWGSDATNEDVANYTNRILMNDGTNQGVSSYIGSLLGTIEDRNLGVKIDDSVLGDIFFDQERINDSMGSSQAINSPSRTALENRMNQMEDKLQSTSTVNNVNVSPIVNNSSTNIRNNTVTGSGLSTFNNEPSYRRYTSRSGELLYR